MGNYPGRMDPHGRQATTIDPCNSSRRRPGCWARWAEELKELCARVCAARYRLTQLAAMLTVVLALLAALGASAQDPGFQVWPSNAGLKPSRLAMTSNRTALYQLTEGEPKGTMVRGPPPSRRRRCLLARTPPRPHARPASHHSSSRCRLLCTAAALARVATSPTIQWIAQSASNGQSTWRRPSLRCALATTP